jgi:hypothetical protein
VCVCVWLCVCCVCYKLVGLTSASLELPSAQDSLPSGGPEKGPPFAPCFGSVYPPFVTVVVEVDSSFGRG